jgi:hypothetical protein
VRVGHVNVRGPVIQAAGVPPMTAVQTPAGDAMVISTPSGNVAVPGAVPAPDVPVGSTVQTPSGPATVTATPEGNVAIPESVAPPEDEWSNEATISELLSPPEVGQPGEATAKTDPVAVTDAGPADVATPAETAEIKKEEVKGGLGKAAVVGGGLLLALKFFL